MTKLCLVMEDQTIGYWAGIYSVSAQCKKALLCVPIFWDYRRNVLQSNIMILIITCVAVEVGSQRYAVSFTLRQSSREAA